MLHRTISQNREERYWNAVGSSKGVSAHVDGGRGFHLSQGLGLTAERINHEADEGFRAPKFIAMKGEKFTGVGCGGVFDADSNLHKW